MMHLNTSISSYLPMQVVAKGMIRRNQGGSIVHVSSIGSSKATEQIMVYAASKAALDQMMKVMALEWGPHQVGRVCGGI